MKTTSRFILTLLISLATLMPALADRDGWDRDSEYGKNFDSSSIVYLTGEIVDINREHKPLPGMADGFSVDLRTADGKVRHVDVGPSWFTDFYKEKWDVAVGDRVEIRGSKTEIDGRPVIIAIWGSKGDRAMTIRSTRGVPVWDLGLDDFWGP